MIGLVDQRHFRGIAAKSARCSHAAETGADDDDPGAVRRFGMRQVQRKRLALQLGLPIATSDDM